ncbi:STAS domain-containing protein [Rheinheimera oceanensis]|uniref:STAS domain-containing protein n=1 Tax=Rheinheimera oceanensis TaxID=2817449 RepID=UPI001BFDB505|nr:STAS domain-containing protein [Rheinheimera oceanensis]
MTIRSSMFNEVPLLHIEGEMTIYTAALLQQQLQLYIGQYSELELNLSQVSDIDSAGLQLLMAAKRQVTNQGAVLRLTGHSPAVLEVFDLCNMAAFFGDPLIIPDVSHG